MSKACGGIVAAFSILLAGCGSHTSSLLLERQTRGPMSEERKAAAPMMRWLVEPASQTAAKGNIEVSVTYALRTFLEQFFSNKQVFGAFAGLNPFFPEQFVFYVKIDNHSGKKIGFNPLEFVLVDDRGNQYASLSTDYATALAESKAPVGMVTRGVLEDANPGYFGIGLPVGKIIGKPQRRFALLRISELQGGLLHDGVAYDGLISFWSPHREAKRVKLLMVLKTDYNALEQPQTIIEFPFEFGLGQQTMTPSPEAHAPRQGSR